MLTWLESGAAGAAAIVVPILTTIIPTVVFIVTQLYLLFDKWL